MLYVFSLFLPPIEPIQFVIIQYENELSEMEKELYLLTGSRL